MNGEQGGGLKVACPCVRVVKRRARATYRRLATPVTMRRVCELQAVALRFGVFLLIGQRFAVCGSIDRV